MEDVHPNRFDQHRILHEMTREAHERCQARIERAIIDD